MKGMRSAGVLNLRPQIVAFYSCNNGVLAKLSMEQRVSGRKNVEDRGMDVGGWSGVFRI
jgi:hypothetical protein